jgi:hypothetical protein
MPKWVLEDDCLAPRPQLKIEYTGPNPFEIYRKAEGILRTIWQVGGVDYWERDFRWDVTSDPRSFFVRICINKGFDARSKAFVEVIMQGSQPADPTKNGKVTILIGAKLKSEFSISSAFQRLPIYKSLLWAYNKIFYESVRRGYIKLCQDFLEKTWREFRANLSMPTA